MTEQFRIGDRDIGRGSLCLVIAEAGVNHNGDVALAHRLVDAAAEAGADAVKFQTFVADKLVAATAPKAPYQERTTGAGESQRDMLRRLALTADDFAALQRHCVERRILFLSTPFDEDSLTLLVRLAVPALKIGSGDLTNHLLLRRAGRTGLPVILSSGMAGLGEIEAALAAVEVAGARAIALLHCTSNYPTPPAEVNLRAMDTLSAAFGRPVGYSDHTEGGTVAVAAVARGACIVEKHFTLDRALPGPDHRASLEPGALAAMIADIRRVEQALGTGIKQPATTEAEVAAVARRSLFLARAVTAGTPLAEDDLTAMRPAGGIAPDRLDLVLGRPAATDLPAGAMLRWRDLAE